MLIIKNICKAYEIDNGEIYDLLKNKECKYLLLLLMREFRCFDKSFIKEQLKLKSDRTIINNIKKAEEKLLINREFREEFFQLEEKIEKKI